MSDGNHRMVSLLLLYSLVAVGSLLPAREARAQDVLNLDQAFPISQADVFFGAR